MSEELFGKWYVYRYSFKDEFPVLKAPETTLEISGQTARFELAGWTEPAEIEMVDRGNSVWSSQEAGSFDSFGVRWNVIDCDEHDVLTGQIFDKAQPDVYRDAFVAVRSRRTSRLPEQEVYHFGGIYNSPFQETEGPFEPWASNISIHVSRWERVIQIGQLTYDILSNELYLGGLKITGRLHPTAQDEPDHGLSFWILPVVQPDQAGHLLATGVYDRHFEIAASTHDPDCRDHLTIC